MALFSTPQQVAPREVLKARRRALTEDARAGRIRRVLAIRFGRLGDVLFTTPALARLSEELPGVHLDYLTRGACASLVADHPAVAEVLRFEPGWPRPGRRARAVLTRELAARGYDLALVFESDHPTRFWLEALCRAAGIRHVVSRSSFVPQGSVPPGMHSCDRHQAFLGMLGLEPGTASYSLQPSEGDAQRAREFLAEREVGEAPLVALQAGSHYSMWPGAQLLPGLRHKFYKMWPEAHWSALGERLGRELGARLLLPGTANERPLAERIAAQAGAPAGRAPIVAAGDTSVGLLAALLARCRLVVSVDTGTMHMAAALGVPTVALYGPTNPGHHGPYRRDDSCVVVRSGVACSPCRKAARKRCALNVCMTELAPARVFEAARTLLARTDAASAGPSA